VSLHGAAATEPGIDSASAALTSLAEVIATRLDDADWSLKRDLVKLLINRIELNREEIRLVYKVPPNPFVLSPDNRGFLQHWLSRQNVAPGERWLALRAERNPGTVWQSR
jgi:site-specific DNA recombinase